MPTRREFLTTTAAGVAATLGSASMAWARRASAKFKVGITDWNLDLEGDPRAVALAKELGFDGVQISLSNRNGKDWVGDDVLDQFVAESKRLQFPLASVCLNILHRNYLKSDPLGPRRVADAIPMAKRVGVTLIDKKPSMIETAEEFGTKVYYGDGLRLDLLRTAGDFERSMMRTLSFAEIVSSRPRMIPAFCASGPSSFSASPTKSISAGVFSAPGPKNGSRMTCTPTRFAIGMASATRRGPSGSDFR